MKVGIKTTQQSKGLQDVVPHLPDRREEPPVLLLADAGGQLEPAHVGAGRGGRDGRREAGERARQLDERAQLQEGRQGDTQFNLTTLFLGIFLHNTLRNIGPIRSD